MVGLSRRMPMPVAVLLQAVVFGFAHGGYGTWSHVIIAGLFGLVSGTVAWRFGIWAALALHFLVDLFAFGADASSNVPWLWQAIVWGFLANCALTFGYTAWRVVQRLEARKAPPTA
jgi:membrane protease YdiL (CAAX protease family)